MRMVASLRPRSKMEEGEAERTGGAALVVETSLGPGRGEVQG